MDRVKVSVDMVIDGLYKNIESEEVVSSGKYGNLKKEITSVKSTSKYMDDYQKELGLVSKVDYEKGNICWNCSRLTRCPKVRDKNRESIKEYPFIITGIMISFVNHNQEQRYLEALEEYEKLQDQGDYVISEHQELEANLNNNGKEVDIINVYKCKSFYSDEQARLDAKKNSAKIKTPTKKLVQKKKEKHEELSLPDILSKYFK